MPGPIYKALSGNGATSPTPGATAPESSFFDILTRKLANREIGVLDTQLQRERHARTGRVVRMDIDPATGRKIKIFDDGTTELQ